MAGSVAWIFDGIGAILALSLLTWIASSIYKSVRLFADSQVVYEWLKANTCDEFQKSHKTLLEISNGTRFSEERARNACLKNPKIMQSTSMPGSYSIWRVEPDAPLQLFI